MALVVGKSVEKSLGFLKGNIGGKELGSHKIQLSHKVRKQINARLCFSYHIRYLCKGHYNESYPV